MVEPMLALLLLHAAPLAHAGPWVHPKGQGYVRAGFDHFQGADGVVSGASTGLQYRSESINVYGEWGLGRSVQLVGSLPFLIATQRDPNLGGPVWRHTWTGDARLELDWAPREGVPVAFGVEARVPTYRDPEDYAVAQGLDPILLPAYAGLFPQLGDQGFDLTLKALGGLGFEHGWLWGEAGPRLRFGGFASGLHAAGSGGIWAVEDRVALGAWSALAVKAPWITPENATRQEWSLIGQAIFAAPELAPGWAFELRGGGVIWAESATRGVMLGAGLSYSAKPRRDAPRSPA